MKRSIKSKCVRQDAEPKPTRSYSRCFVIDDPIKNTYGYHLSFKRSINSQMCEAGDVEPEPIWTYLRRFVTDDRENIKNWFTPQVCQRAIQ